MFNRLIILCLIASVPQTALASALTDYENIPASAQEELFADESADEIEAAEEIKVPTSLKLVGRGIKNRTTKEVIVLACTGKLVPTTGEPSCKHLRFVHYSPKTQTTTFVGNEVRVYTEHQAEPDEKQLRKIMILINKHVTALKKESHRNRHRLILTVLSLGSWGGMGYLTYGVGIATWPGIATWVGAIAAIMGIQELLLRPSFLSKNGSVSKSLSNKDGWNWSIKPKTVSAKTFGWLKQYIDEKNVDWADAE